LEEQALRTPDAPAVSFEDGSSLTYQELHRRAEVIATTLRSYGLGANDLVGVRVERSIGLVVALLGVLKSGAAYVAIDPSFPLERQNYILEDAGAKVLIVTHKPPTDPSYNKKKEEEEKASNPHLQILKVGPLGDLMGPRAAANCSNSSSSDSNSRSDIRSTSSSSTTTTTTTTSISKKQDPSSLAYVL